jgi:HK97 family phage portal protein
MSWKEIFNFRKKPARSVQGARLYVPGSRSKTYVNDDTAMTISAYYRGVIFISTQIAKLPWEVKDKTNKVLEEHSLAKLISLSPNSEMNTMTFRLCLTQQAIHFGNGYAEIERDGAGRPIALWPLDSKAVDLVRAQDEGGRAGQLFYRVAKASLDQPGEDAFIPVRDMLHIKNFHTKSGLVGEGLVAFANDTLGISKAADRMASGIFENGGVPSMVLKHPNTLSDEAHQRLKQSWRDENGGRRAGGIQILEEGLSVEALDMDPEVLQFIESRKFGVLEIARFLGLPPTKLFDNTNATFSNVENANLEVITDTLDAWACNWEMEADVKLLNNRYGGLYTELDLFSVSRGDMKTRADYFSKMMQSGSMTPNEIRRREGMTPYKEGDKFYIAVNNFTPANRVEDLIDADIKAKETKSEPADPSKAEEEKTLRALAFGVLKS